MTTDEALHAVSEERLRRDLFHLAEDPLPFRKVNFTLPGHTRCTLDEADDFIEDRLTGLGLQVTRTPCQVQAYRCDSSKPLHHWYSTPDPKDAWYTANNLEATLPGRTDPDEIIQLISHKDSMSWIDSPGAHDNAAGTVVNLELARILSSIPLHRSVRVLFCNEEHTPWTSRIAADAAKARGDNIIAVLNQDSLAGKSDADREAGRMTHAVGYSTEEGEPLADMLVRLNAQRELGLKVAKVFKEHVNDDDGMFIKAGYRTTVMNVGSFPYGDAEYHLVGDRPGRVDIENLRRSAQLVLATVLELDRHGMASGPESGGGQPHARHHVPPTPADRS